MEAHKDNQVISEPSILKLLVFALPGDLFRFLKHPVHLVEVEVAEYG